MARTIQQIQDEIIAEKNADSILDDLNSTSNVSIWLAWTYIVAFCIWTLEKLFDIHISATKITLEEDRRLTLPWYSKKALLFQLGSSIVDGTDDYDNSNLSEAQIEAQRIIKYAKSIESNGIVTVKVAKDAGNGLEPLDSLTEYPAASDYMQDIKGGGVNLQLISFDGDKILLDLDIKYNPQILTNTGARIDGTDSTPILNAVKDFLTTMGVDDFGGILRIDRLEDALQKVDGVVQPTILRCRCAKNDVNSFIDVTEKYIPYAGYLKIFDDINDLSITYKV